MRHSLLVGYFMAMVLAAGCGTGQVKDTGGSCVC